MGGPTNRRILVTGALGQIGMELLDALSEKFGAENIVATDIREPDNFGNAEINFLKLDVLDFDKFESLITEYNICLLYTSDAADE